MNKLDTKRVSPRPYSQEFYRDGASTYEEADEGFDIRKILNALWRGKWLILATMLVCAALAAISVANDEPSYTATSRVIFDPDRLQIVQTQEAVEETDALRSGLGNQIEILQSSMVLQRVIDDLELMTHPLYGYTEGEAPPSGIAAIFATIGDILTGNDAGGNADAEPPKIIPPSDLTEAQRERLRLSIERRIGYQLVLEPIEGSRVISIQFTSPDPDLSANVANSVAEQYIAAQTQQKQEDVAAVLEMIGGRVESLKERLDAAQNLVESERLKMTEEQVQSPEITRFQITALNEALANLRLEITASEGVVERAETALREDTDLWSVNEFRESDLINEFRRAEIALLDELAALKAIAGSHEGNPQRLVIESRLEEVRRSIREEASSIVSSLRFNTESLRSQEVQLREMLRELERTSISQASEEVRMERLERNAVASQTIYESFLDRMNEVSEQANLQTSDARILSAAPTPLYPDRSREKKFLIAALAAGLLLGIGITLAREFLNTSFRDPEDLQDEARVPMLSAIPQMGRRRNPRQLIDHIISKPRSVMAEAVRHLRTSVLFADPADPPKVVMFTSSVPGEGKSTTSLLMGVTSRAVGRSTIVVGCDLRQRPFASIMGSGGGWMSRDKQPGGFMALLNGNCTLEEAVYVEPKSKVHILAPRTSEKIKGSPADILASPEFTDLIRDLREKYDLVILDTPPALAVTDARLLTRLADSVVYLVRWNSTNRNAVKVGLNELRSMDANVTGVAMTLVSQAKAAKFSDNEFFYRSEYSSYFS